MLAWRLSNTLDTAAAVLRASWQRSLGAIEIPIFNTDQGSQFTSIAFTAAAMEAGNTVLDSRAVGAWSFPGQRVYRAAMARISLKYPAVVPARLADGFVAHVPADQTSGSSSIEVRPHRHWGASGRRRRPTCGTRHRTVGAIARTPEQVANAGYEAGGASCPICERGVIHCPQDQAPRPRTPTALLPPPVGRVQGGMTTTDTLNHPKGTVQPTGTTLHSLRPAPARRAYAAVPEAKHIVSPSRRGLKALTVWVDPAVHQQLRMLTLEQQRPAEDMLREALAELFQKHGLSRLQQ